jgi:hypothetical protein
MREYLPISSVRDLDLAKSVINWSTRNARYFLSGIFYLWQGRI